MIDLHGNMFTTRLISTGIVDSEQSGSVDTEAAIERLKQLDSKIEELDRERASLLDERDSVMNAINSSIRDVEDPVKRKELYRQLDEMINEATKEV